MDFSELKDELEGLHSSSYSWALSCCRRDRAEAEEVLQTVYLKILEGKARYRSESNLKTWLFAVIRKTAASQHRRTLLRRLRFAGAAEQAHRQVCPSAEPEMTFERSETRLRFQNALKNLPERQRQTLHLVFYEDLSLREAAAVMGISIGSARRHYERGKKGLRETLERTEVTYGNDWRGKENPGSIS